MVDALDIRHGFRNDRTGLIQQEHHPVHLRCDLRPQVRTPNPNRHDTEHSHLNGDAVANPIKLLAVDRVTVDLRPLLPLERVAVFEILDVHDAVGLPQPHEVRTSTVGERPTDRAEHR